jgi:hypothetical protein
MVRSWLIALGLGLVVTVLVGTVEWTHDGGNASLSTLANAKIKTDFRAPSGVSKNIIVFNPTPNINVLFSALYGDGVGDRKTAYSRGKGLTRAEVVCLGDVRSRFVRIGEISGYDPIENLQACPTMASAGGRHPTIFPFDGEVVAGDIIDTPKIGFLPIYGRINNDISSYLPLSDITSDINGCLRSAVGLSSEPESDDQQSRAEGDESGRDQRVQSHTLGGFIHRLRGSVHALLGDKIVFLVLAGFGFAVLSGLGGGLILDNVHREGNRKRLGWLLLCCSFPLFALCFLLGLP